MPFIEKNTSVSFYQQLYEQLVANIERGVYPTGKKLPSIRQMANELGVSNTTVELAYQRICEEGYAEAKRGSGFIVNPISHDLSDSSDIASFSKEYRDDLADLLALSEKLNATPAPLEYDFAYDAIDPTSFPFGL